MEAVKENGYALQYASEKLKDDKDIVLEAVKENLKAFKFSSRTFKNDFFLKDIE